MNLLVISHTPHYRKDDLVLGWSATVREINYLATIFAKVYHLAPLLESNSPQTGSAYVDNVTFIPIKEVKGNSTVSIFQSIINCYSIIKTVSKYLLECNYFHLRLPTGMGLILIPYLILSSKNGWFKYAGNWVDKSKPVSYSVQKLMLQLQRKKKVTINGHWPGQHKNIISFENPCLTDEELLQGSKVSTNKRFDQGLNLLFVGRVDNRKGFDKLIDMINIIDASNDIKEVIIVGDGEIDYYQKQNTSKVKFVFTGGLSRDKINPYYEESHILILPSLSEGFPKVVAEAAAFGCVPAITNISSLSQYIGSANGLLFSSFDPPRMAEELQELIRNKLELKRKSMEVTKLANKFTYTYYLQRIQRELLT